MNTLKQITCAGLLSAMVLIGYATPASAQAQSNGISHLPVEEQRAILLAQIRELIAILQQLQARAQLEQSTAAFDKATQRLGNEETLIEIETFIDYRSPFSKKFHETLQTLVENYDGEVSVQYRHFPLTQLHPEADALAELAVCTGHLGGQEAFVALSDYVLLREGVTQVVPYSEALTHANTLVSRSQLQACLASDLPKDVVRKDVDYGMGRKVQGVPMSYISLGSQEEPINGAQPYDILENIVENILSQVN